MKEIFMTYNSTSELAGVLSSKKAHESWSRHKIPAADYSDKSWTGGHTLNDALELLRDGDKEAASKIKSEGDILSVKTGNTPKIESAVVGCIPNVPAYLTGVPKQMLRVIREPQRTPVISIYVDTAIYDGIDLNKVAKAAAKITSVIYATELAGIRVNLWAVCGSRRDGNSYGFRVKLKDAHSSVNLLNIAYPLTRPSFVRCIYLHWLECYSKKYIKNHGGVMSGDTIKSEFELNDGVVFSMRDTVESGSTVDDLAKKVNEYIKAHNN